jgi:cobalt-zinc-cadmium efflux system membrane fusion protein
MNILCSALLAALVAAAPAYAEGDHEHDHGHDSHGGHGHGDHDDEERGPHGGRIVEEGSRRIEMKIFETGVDPQLRLWVYDGDELVDPQKVTATAELTRLGQEAEALSFRPVGDYLLGDKVIHEPHSFRIEVTASWNDKEVCGQIETIEARVRLAADVAAAGGVATEVATRRELGRQLRLTGRIGVPTDRIARLRPRFAGIVREAAASIGSAVREGDVLATVESSATLALYAIRSPLDGIVIDRSASVGAAAREDDELFVVADLTSVWADLDVYGADAPMVKVGETVRVADEARQKEQSAKISYVSPLRDVHTQTTLARAVLDNRDGRWAPGTFVTAMIAIEEEPAEVAIPISALQSWRGRDAVFVQIGDVFEVRPVVVGRRGPALIEIREGLRDGTVVATGNTFLLRAEIEKAGAAHDH